MSNAKSLQTDRCERFSQQYLLAHVKFFWFQTTHAFESRSFRTGEKQGFLHSRQTIRDHSVELLVIGWLEEGTACICSMAWLVWVQVLRCPFQVYRTWQFQPKRASQPIHLQVGPCPHRLLHGGMAVFALARLWAADGVAGELGLAPPGRRCLHAQSLTHYTMLVPTFRTA